MVVGATLAVLLIISLTALAIAVVAEATTNSNFKNVPN